MNRRSFFSGLTAAVASLAWWRPKSDGAIYHAADTQSLSAELKKRFYSDKFVEFRISESHTKSGRIIFGFMILKNAITDGQYDSYRPLFSIGVPTGHKRKSSDYSLSPGRRVIDFRIVDERIVSA